MSKIDSFKFLESEIATIRKMKYGEKWPVVYFIHNDKEAYIGETTNVYLRTSQHIKDPARNSLENIHIISDEEFNKSAIMDIESSLIKYVSADKKFTLQNLNSGLQFHNYYQRKIYEDKFFKIWEKLRQRKLVHSSLRDIENSDLFKYSPYKALTSDQYLAVDFILHSLAENINTSKTFIINGSAGTGKTVLAVYLIKLLSSFKKHQTFNEDEDIVYLKSLFNIFSQNSDLRIGLVIPQTSLRKTLRRVFKGIDGLNSNMVLGPSDVAKSTFDLLVVDEAHRLKRRKNITNYADFDGTNVKLGLSLDSTELDWIVHQSKHQIFFYDSEQMIRPSDIPENIFSKFNFSQSENIFSYQLESQMRCLGGNDYIRYIKSIFSLNPPPEKLKFENYQFGIYEKIEDLVNRIKHENSSFGLSRVISGYAWPWKSKGDKTGLIKDIHIENLGLVWNSTLEDWVNSNNSINEVGCIHTTQGYDLNFAGVIIGKDLGFDPVTQKLFISREHYFDKKGFYGVNDPEELFTYIINIYQTLCLRAIKGTFIYVCDDNLRTYLKQYIPIIS